jgi:hypothetical protein
MAVTNESNLNAHHFVKNARLNLRLQHWLYIWYSQSGVKNEGQRSGGSVLRLMFVASFLWRKNGCHKWVQFKCPSLRQKCSVELETSALALYKVFTKRCKKRRPTKRGKCTSFDVLQHPSLSRKNGCHKWVQIKCPSLRQKWSIELQTLALMHVVWIEVRE